MQELFCVVCQCVPYAGTVGMNRVYGLLVKPRYADDILSLNFRERFLYVRTRGEGKNMLNIAVYGKGGI